MTGRRWIWVPLAGLVTAFLLSLYGYWTYGELRSRLGSMLRGQGEAVTETIATVLRASSSTLEALETELRQNLHLKATLLASTPELEDSLDSFALATGLRRILLLDASHRVRRVSEPLPQPSEAPGADLLSDWELRAFSRELAGSVKDGVLIREWAEPGRSPLVVAAVRMPDGGVAVLVRDASVFAGVRREASAERLAERLESETGLAYVRIGDRPSTDRGTANTSGAVRLHDGTRAALHVGLDRRPASEALFLYRASALRFGIPFFVFVCVASWILGRALRRRAALEERVRRDGRLASLGMLAANIAHEVRNPLNAIGLAAQRLERAPEHAPELAPLIVQETQRLSRTVNEVLLSASPARRRPIEVSAKKFLAIVTGLAGEEATSKGVELRTRCEEGLVLSCDADLLRGAAWNLLRNAIQAAPRGSVVDVVIQRVSHEIHLLVEDRGAGIPPEDRSAVFEPFRTTRCEGSGLGLPTALAAAQAHGGGIEIESRPGGGTRFRLRIPAHGARGALA